MRWRVALASCSSSPTGLADHAGLVEALAQRDVLAEWIPWDDTGTDWGAYDLVVIRATWDYTEKLAAFLDWVEQVAAATTLANPAAVVCWNHHKRYLTELAGAGVPTVPTALVRAGDADPAAALRAHGSGRVVVKPAVGVGGNDAVRGAADDPVVHEHLRTLLSSAGDALVQPFLGGIETAGETSVVVVGGRVSHTVVKVPAAGEFRIHEHRGGDYAPAVPAPEQGDIALAACEAARAVTGSDLLYARADLVPGDDGRPLIMELELIEPSLYLHTVPSATPTLAAAIVDALTD